MIYAASSKLMGSVFVSFTYVFLRWDYEWCYMKEQAYIKFHMFCAVFPLLGISFGVLLKPDQT